MALPLPPGLTPSETAFLCEMELITVIPRQRLESLRLLAVSFCTLSKTRQRMSASTKHSISQTLNELLFIQGETPALRPPHRTDMPLWLALLLKRQRRADIAPPAWLHPDPLREILDRESNEAHVDAFSPAAPLPNLNSDVNTPPFIPTSVAAASADFLPYHWLEIGQTLLAAAAEDIPDAEQVRRLLRDLQEVRMAKIRRGVEVLDGSAGVQMNGVGAMEVGEARAFVTGVLDGLRRLGAPREAANRERAEEGRGIEAEDEDEEMI